MVYINLRLKKPHTIHSLIHSFIPSCPTHPFFVRSLKPDRKCTTATLGIGTDYIYNSVGQGRNMVYGLRAQSPKYDWDQGSEERAQGSEEWDQGSQGF